MFSRQLHLLVYSNNDDVADAIAAATQQHFERFSIRRESDFSAAAVFPVAKRTSVVLVDCRVGLQEAIEGIRCMRAHHSTQFVPVILLVAKVDESLMDALCLEGTDFQVLPLNANELAARIHTMLRCRNAYRRLDQQNQVLTYLAVFDDLTGLYNRRFILGTLEAELQKADSARTGVGMFLIDLDNFKEVNDTCGHLAGDRVLIQFADLIKSCLRPVDMIGRYGGDEFCLVVPNTTERLCSDIAQRLLDCMKDQNFGPTEDCDIVVTASIGVGFSPPGSSWAVRELIGAADKALYECKLKGRNSFAVQVLRHAMAG